MHHKQNEPSERFMEFVALFFVFMIMVVLFVKILFF